MVEVSDARNLKANNAHKESTIKEFEKSNKSELFYSRTNVSTSGHRKKGITRSGRRSGSSSTDGNVVHGKSMLIESDGEQSKSGPAAEVQKSILGVVGCWSKVGMTNVFGIYCKKKVGKGVESTQKNIFGMGSTIDS